MGPETSAAVALVDRRRSVADEGARVSVAGVYGRVFAIVATAFLSLVIVLTLGFGGPRLRLIFDDFGVTVSPVGEAYLAAGAWLDMFGPIGVVALGLLAVTGVVWLGWWLWRRPVALLAMLLLTVVAWSGMVTSFWRPLDQMIVALNKQARTSQGP